MTASQPSYDDVTRRLAEAEQTLDAIRSGNVDAFVVSTHGGPQIYTLESADVLYRLLIEQMPEGAAALTADGTIVFANQTFADMLGHEVSELLACNLMDFAHSADRDLLERLLTSRSEFASTEIQLGAEPGPVLLLSVRSVGDFPDSLLCVVAVDQTERIRAERALKAAEERFRSAFDDAPIGMALLDETGVTERVNAALLEITGLGMADIVGSRLPWLPRESDDDFVIRDGMIEVNLRHGPDLGDDIWVAAQTTAVRDDDDQLRHTIVQVLDITQRRRSEASLRYVADHDGLTGLVNRRGFEIAMQRHLSLADRHHVDGALILLDVDHFKYINDARGHHVGDLVLSALATALGERLRTSDVMGRLGGDEFAILVPFTSLDAARGLAEELVRTAADLQITELVGLRQLTVSAGVAPLEHEGRSFGELMALADLALYDAKDAGRNRVAVYDPSHQGASETEQRMTWLARIKEALDTDSLVVHAQPIVE
ncbi:MAG: sensor domain-containing diguanylate cyclase, partial [Frankiaceae bacterium]|nr:sensor domain-containing diguanylate cyclase [Frankiaceae bacterium]